MIWEQQGLAEASPALRGTRLAFRFSPPEELPESESPSEDYRHWVLHLHAAMPGVDLDRTFMLPVFRIGGEQSRQRIPDSHAALLARGPTVSGGRAVRVRSDARGLELHYPALRNPGATATMALFALIFLGSGFFWIYVSEGGFGGSFFGIILNVVLYLVIGVIVVAGALLTIAAVYMAGNSLTVRADEDGIATTRRLFGIPLLRRRWRPAKSSPSTPRWACAPARAPARPSTSVSWPRAPGDVKSSSATGSRTRPWWRSSARRSRGPVG